jgi:hypothetical protein
VGLYLSFRLKFLHSSCHKDKDPASPKLLSPENCRSRSRTVTADLRHPTDIRLLNRLSSTPDERPQKLTADPQSMVFDPRLLIVSLLPQILGRWYSARNLRLQIVDRRSWVHVLRTPSAPLDDSKHKIMIRIHEIIQGENLISLTASTRLRPSASTLVLRH